MNIKTITEGNREAWNEATAYHQKARGNHLLEGFARPGFTALDRDCDDVLITNLKSINLAGKTIAQLPCNNGRELLSLMRLGAKQAVGFDISDAAIDEARNLSKVSKLNAYFERINILEIDEKYNGKFDFIYISEGSLQWFPDLSDYFGVVSRLLKKDASVLIYEIHPLAYLFEQGLSPVDSHSIGTVSYFEKGPYSYEDGLDYVGQTKYNAKKCYWFMHTLADILNALIQSGIEPLSLNEYTEEMANNAAAKQFNKLPLSYILIGKKK